eukprot:3712935-Prymnesium_polylepis.1
MSTNFSHFDAEAGSANADLELDQSSQQKGKQRIAQDEDETAGAAKPQVQATQRSLSAIGGLCCLCGGVIA